ncbi:hypothetical protein D3C87_1821020 [compost metagenome]
MRVLDLVRLYEWLGKPDDLPFAVLLVPLGRKNIDRHLGTGLATVLEGAHGALSAYLLFTP